MKRLLLNFWTNTSGATAIEYGLIASLIGIAVIGGAKALGSGLSGELTSITAAINNK